MLKMCGTLLRGWLTWLIWHTGTIHVSQVSHMGQMSQLSWATLGRGTQVQPRQDSTILSVLYAELL